MITDKVYLSALRKTAPETTLEEMEDALVRQSSLDALISLLQKEIQNLSGKRARLTLLTLARVRLATLLEKKSFLHDSQEALDAAIKAAVLWGQFLNNANGARKTQLRALWLSGLHFPAQLHRAIEISNGPQATLHPRNTPPANFWSKPRLQLAEIQACLKRAQLEPMVQNMCFRIVKNVLAQASAAMKNEGIKTEIAQGLLFYSLSAALAVEKLNPIGIECSEIPFNSRPQQHLQFPEMQGWAMDLAKGIPTYEHLQIPSADIFSLGLLRTLVTNWGLRPRGTIQKLSRGSSAQNFAVSTAYLILPPSVESQPRHQGGGEHAVNWEILLQPHASVSQLRQGLKKWGAEGFFVVPLHQGDGQPLTLVKTTMPLSMAQQAKEWCFTEGVAERINTYHVNTESLAMHEVCLPWGRGDHQEVVTVVENWWMDKVVRVIPKEEDVIKIASQTGFTTEAVRSDIVNAWQRWHAKKLDAVEKR